MSDKHSPLPWRVEFVPSAGIHIKSTMKVFDKDELVKTFSGPTSNNVSFYLNSDGCLVANLLYEEWVQFPPEGWDDMQKANADLIVKAVNSHAKLVEALKKTQGMLTEVINYKDTKRGLRWHRDFIAQALAESGEE